MPHNDHMTPAGQYPPTFVPSPAFMRRLDQAASECIDGDNGGTWAPASPIIIGGNGVALTGLAQATGGVLTGARAAPRALKITPDQPATWIAGVRARTVVFLLRDFSARNDENSIYTTSFVPYDESAVPGTVSTTANSPALNSVGAVLWTTPSTTVRLITPLAPYRCSVGKDSSTGNGVIPVLRMRVGQPANPASLTGMPGFRLTRVNAAGVWDSTFDMVIPTWVALQAHVLGDLVIPTSPNGRQFRCSVAGTSGASQPAAFTTATTGQTVVDSGASWICEVGPTGATGHYITMPLPATAALYFARGQYQDIALPPNLTRNGTFFTGAAGVAGQAAACFLIDILDKSGTNNQFHSLSITFRSTTYTTAI